MNSHLRVAIIGTGFAGLGAAIRLLQEGHTDFLVFERSNDVGGVWRENTYPGCACDVESHLYCYSFAPNPNWSHTYSRQPEILRYLRECAERFGVRPHIRFEHAVHEARWNDHAQHWRLRTSHGDFTADVLVGAVGALSEPAIPAIPGLERFRGASFHSAKWDHAVDLRGKRVGSIGTGASAAQYIPVIAPEVAELTVFQRTPAWVIPRHDVAFDDDFKALLRRSTLARHWTRGSIYWRREAIALGFLHPELGRMGERITKRFLARKVADPELRARLTPTYRMGCKRVIVSDDYYPALTRPNVRVETAAITEVNEHGVRTDDGREHPLDVLILGTGFQVTEMPFARHLHGRGGRSLHDAWGGSMNAYLGTTVAGFPNFFLIPGPNTGLGHSSMVLMIEAQVEHLLGALRHLDATRSASIEPRAAAQRRYVDEVDRKLARTIWATGCRSWYLDATGRNSTLWPGHTFSFMRRVRAFDPSAYVTEERHNAAVELPLQSRLERFAGQLLTRIPRKLLAPRPIVRDGLTLEPEVQAILAVRSLTGARSLTADSIVAARSRMRRDAVTGAGTPVSVGTIRDLTLSPTVRARHYIPASGGRGPLLVYFHGGGFVLGDLESHDAPCRRLCRDAGVHVLSIDYRLAPEHPHPAAFDDAMAAYAWTLDHAERLGVDPTRIAVAGDSAGGNLAAAVTQEARRRGMRQPALQLLIYPTVNRLRSFRSNELFGSGFMLEASDMEWFSRQYRASRFGVEDVTADPGLESNLHGLARAVVITAGFDPLRDEGEEYAERLQRAGVPTTLRRFDGLVHGFVHMTGVSRACDAAVSAIGAELRQALASVGTAHDGRPTPEISR